MRKRGYKENWKKGQLFSPLNLRSAGCISGVSSHWRHIWHDDLGQKVSCLAGVLLAVRQVGLLDLISMLADVVLVVADDLRLSRRDALYRGTVVLITIVSDCPSLMWIFERELKRTGVAKY